jgi:putative transcriptional regulator
MAISYNGLWKLLIDKDMKKGDLCKSTGLSSSTMAKMTNGESVNLSVLERICEKLDCDFADLVNYKRTQEEKSSARWSNSHFPSENKED